MKKFSINIGIVLWTFLIPCTSFSQYGMDFCITDRGNTGCKNLSDPSNDPYGDYTGRHHGAGGPLSPGTGGPTMGGDLGSFLGGFTEKVKDAVLSLDGKYRNKKKKEKEKRSLVANVSSRLQQIERGSQLIQQNLDDMKSELSSSDTPSALQHTGVVPETDWPEINFEPQNGQDSADIPEFMTPIISEKGEAVRDAFEKSERAKSTARNLDVDYPDSFDKAAKGAIVMADRHYYEGNNAQGDQYIAFSSEIIDQGLYSSPYYGSGKDWFEALHGYDIYGKKLDSAGYTYAMVGAAQSLATRKAFTDIGGAAVKNYPRLTLIQGGAGTSSGLTFLQKVGPIGIKLARLTNAVGVILTAITSTDTGGVDLPWDQKHIIPSEMNDPRITMPSPPFSADPSEWMEYLTGTGRYSGQTGVIQDKDRELADALLKDGYRDPKQIEKIINFAKVGSWSDVFMAGLGPKDLVNNELFREKLRADKGIPADWIFGSTTKGKKDGISFSRPGSLKSDEVRIMPGNPNSPYPNSQKPYVRIQFGGRPYDKNGNLLPDEFRDEAHIPLDEFKFPF